MRERIDVCLSKAVLVSDRYQDAAKLIVALAGRNPQAGVALAEEYLKAWAYRHDPQVPEAIRRKYNLAAEARIAVTPIMMEKNIAGLAEMMDLFRASGIPPRNAELLVGAFDVCYSKAEVYRRTHIEKVFGPIDADGRGGLLSHDPHDDARAVLAVAERWRCNWSPARGAASRKRWTWSAPGTRRPST